jgi:hypothetical protein
MKGAEGGSDIGHLLSYWLGVTGLVYPNSAQRNVENDLDISIPVKPCAT